MPALLTALLGPMLPAGTALAAPVAPSASTSAASAPAQNPAPVQDPAPAPAQDPAPPASPRTDPAEPAAEPCPVLPLAPLGDPGDAARRVALESGGTACLTVTVERPGLHQVRIEGGYPSSLTLSSGGAPVDCPGLDMAPCRLAAGTYTLGIVTRTGYAFDSRFAMVPLMAGPGCAGPVGTAFGTAPTTGTVPSELGVVCHSFAAAPGELVVTDFQESPSANGHAWITDDTGRHLCTVGYPCVLPAGTGGYRLLGYADLPVAYTLTVRQVTHPVGCADASVTAYGSVPDAVPAPAGCRTFTPTATGPYEISAHDASGVWSTVKVYAPTGRICDSFVACTLTAGVTYTLVTDDAVRILDLRSSKGCEDVSPGRPHRGGLTAPHEADCVNLPAPRNARVAVLASPVGSDSAPYIRVLDATGTLLCWDVKQLSSGTCELDGTAPYRAVVESGYQGRDTGSYGLVVHRTDEPSHCRTFPAGDFGANPAGATVTTGGDSFADCLTIPAGDHSARELLSFTATAGHGSLGVSLLDENGRETCAPDLNGNFSYNSPLNCVLTPGLSYTLLLQGDGRSAEHSLVRRDVTATARGCVDTPATRVGAPGLAVTPAGPGTLVCHRVTTADARDTLHLNSRYTATGAERGIGVYGATGKAACQEFDAGCAVSGSTAYQAIVEAGDGDTTAPAYHFDAFRVGTTAGPAPECVRVPDVTYGFGPLTATLSEQRPALCAVLPTRSNDWFNLAFAPAPHLNRAPTPWMYSGPYLRNACSTRGGEYYACVVPAKDFNEYVPRPSVLVIGLPSVPSQAPTEVRATGYCQYGCGTVTRAVTAVGPGTVGAGKITMSVTGAALHEKDRVEVAGGSYRARSTTVSVAPDRRSMQVSLDLTNAPRTALKLTVVTHDGMEYPRGTVTVVAPLRATAAPVLTGTAVVGGKVTASAGSWSPGGASYTYQWLAGGAPIAGATAASYTLPAALLGKQLSVAVTARLAGHPVVTASSAAVTVKAVAPKVTRAPFVSGAVRVGNRVTAVVGAWTPAPTSYAYQWRANGAAIAGATAAAYTVPGSLAGKKLTVTVTAHRTGHLSGSATSAAYAVAAGPTPKATRAPSLTGTVKVGRTLTLNRGTWTPAPTSYAYQWYANGRPVAGATKATFTPSKAQRGLRIGARVTAYRTGHTPGVAWTPATGAVAP